MTDDAELIARLLGAAQTDTNRQLLNDAAYALEQRTRTITALETELSGCINEKRQWVDEHHAWRVRAQAAETALTAADQRARTAEATTWEQAAEFVASRTTHPFGDQYTWLKSKCCDEFTRRAHAASEEQTHAPDTQG
jgi:hypothetical protein